MPITKLNPKDAESRRSPGRPARSPVEEFLALPDAEKEKIAREFEDPSSADTFRPLNARQRRVWSQVKKKMGRPLKGKGAKVISLSVERELLEKADRLAKKKGITRAAFVAAGLRAVLKSPKLLNTCPELDARITHRAVA